MSDARCQPVELCRGSLARLEYCARCQVVSLHIGAVSLRLSPDAIESLWATLSEALVTLHEHVARQPQAPCHHVRRRFARELS